MKLRSLVIGIGLLALAGCAGVNHVAQSYQPVGTALPVEVTVKHKPEQVVHGTVHYRTYRNSQFTAKPMQLRGQQLWTLLPTDSLRPDATVEYYIDIEKDGKLHTLGSPAAPYSVMFMNESDLVMTNVQDQVHKSHANKPVRIVLQTGGQQVDQPTLLYVLPGIPGDILGSMEYDGRGNYHVTIPSHVVCAGTWRYAVEVPVHGTDYRLPRQGYRQFTVKPAPPAVVAQPTDRNRR